MNLTYDVTMFKETFESEFTFINGFMRNTHRFANRPALTCPLRDKTWTYAELNKEANKLANALAADGVKKNDVVMYQLYNCAEFVFCYLAPQKLGAITSPINFRLSAGETALILEDSKPDVFFYDAECSEMTEKALEISKHKPKKVIMVDFLGKKEAPEGVLTYDQYVANASEEEPAPIERHFYEESVRLYTSGTTGLPKGVQLNHVNDVLSAHDVIMHFPLNPTDKTMNMSPWFHRGGLHSGGPTPTLYCGAEIVICRAFNPRHTMKLAAERGVTFMTGAPAMLKMMNDTIKKTPIEIPSLKGICTMGAPLEKDACIEYQNNLCPNIFNGYGTTESFWNTFLRPFDLPDMAGSAGRSCTDDDVAIVKNYEDRRAEPTELVAKDGEEVGEIIIKCPTKTAYSYYNKPESTQKAFYKGWMYTGDLGVWNDGEFVTIVGRKDDMIVSSGENIHPVQIEEVINENPKVHECVITSVPDDLRGQSLVAYVIKEDESLTAKELTTFCKNHPMLSVYKCPRFYRFVDSLPYTATGKKLHYKVREMALEDMAKGLLERP